MRRGQRFPERSGGGILTARSYPLPKRRSKRLKPPQQSLVVLETQPKRWSVVRRNEVRYLFEDVTDLVQALEQHGIKADGYRTQTFYLKPTGGGQRRLRRYDGAGPWWLEVKKRKGTMVVKRRRQFYGSIPRQRLNGNYWRTAYEWGRWRLTIDSRVRFRRRGKAIDFPGFIVELKGKAERLKTTDAPPAWLGALLTGHEAPGFGKRKWAELTLDV